MKKLIKIIIGILIAVASGIGLSTSYNKLVEIHSNYCCSGLSSCPIYLCESNSEKLGEYTLYVMITIFCDVLVLAMIIGIIKILLDK